MRRFAGIVMCAILPVLSGCGLKAAGDGPEGSVVWNISDLKIIGGHKVLVTGHPRIVEAGGKRGVRLNGVFDALTVTTNPIMGTGAFTIEALFRPDPGGNGDQCVLDVRERVGFDEALIEIRLNDEDQWFLVTAVISGESDRTLSGDEFLHPAGAWYHAALVFDGTTVRQYVNGKEEASGPLSAPPLEAGRTAIGMRIGELAWFKGIAGRIRFTPRALRPGEFIRE